MLDHNHHFSASSLDTLVAMLVPGVSAALNSDGSPAGLYLIMVSVSTVSQPGTPDKKRHNPRQTLLRAVCEHLLPRSAVAGTPFGGQNFIVFPLPLTHKFNPPSLRQIHLHFSHLSGPGPGFLTTATSRKSIFGDRAHAESESLLRGVATRSEASSGSASSASAPSFLRTTVTPIDR